MHARARAAHPRRQDAIAAVRVRSLLRRAQTAALSAQLAARYLDRAKPYAALMEAIDLGTGPLGRAQVFAIRVRDLTIGKLERRGETLRLGAEAGFRAVAEAFQRT